MTDAFILSNALDTNGQNARYVRAARKYGEHEAVIDALAIGNVDPGGVVARLQDAATRHPDVGLRIRSAHKSNQYFMFPNDLQWGHDAPVGQRAEVRSLAAHADVIHLNNSERGLFELGMSKQAKPLLLHHHGSLFRNNPQRMLDTARMYKMVQAVSTIDLQRPAPGILHWLPTAYDIAALQAFGVEHRRVPDGRVRIGHFPTSRPLKNTAVFVQVVKELQAEGLPIDLVPQGLLTEKDPDWLPYWTWDQTMLVKATCDVVYDQMTFGYGCNAVEAWGMGIPVIAGADDWTLRRMKDVWGALPFVAASERTVKDVVRRLVKSHQARTDAGLMGLEHVLKYHDELPALTILAQLYRDAMGVRRRVRIEGKGVTFQSSRRMVMHVAGQPVDFTSGRATVTDEEVVKGLRVKAQRKALGVEEVA